MNKVEALEWAADYAQRIKLFEPVTNARGYSDGWKPPTPAEKAEIIAKLATSVVEESSSVFTGDEVIRRVEALYEQYVTDYGNTQKLIHVNFLNKLKEQFGGR